MIEPTRKPKIAIIGAGPIGLWLAAEMDAAGSAVTLVGRPAWAAQAAQNGLRRRTARGDERIVSAEVTADLPTALASKPGAIFLCTKAYSVAAAVAELTGLPDSGAGVVCFQNGVGAEDRVAAAFGADRTIAGTVTLPVTQTAPGTVREEGAGGGYALAPLTPRGQPLCALLAPGGAQGLDWRALKWSKLLLNVIGNATGAILDMTPAEMYAGPGIFSLELRMLREILAVMRAQRITPVDLPGNPAARLARSVGLLPDWLLAMALKKRFATGRGNKRPSFYYDVANRTGRCEVGYLNGAVAAAGALHGIDAPVNAGLNRVLGEIVSGQADPASWRGQVERLVAACR